MVAPKGHEAYNTQGEGGRPPKYTSEFLEAEAEAFEKWMKNPAHLYFKEFAFERGYSPQRLSEFAESSQRFSEVYLMARQWQEVRLVKGGLMGEFNPGFCKFVMGNVCGWSDHIKQETKLSGDAANPLQFLLETANGVSKELVGNESE